MAPPLYTTAAVIVVSVLTAALNSNASRVWRTGQLPVFRENQYTCATFRQPYCHCFNPADRTHARFPNLRGQSAEEAQQEFAHFVQPGRNVIKNGCSDKIGTLLCFFYFPHCNPPTNETDSMTVIQLQSGDYSLPCRELCEEVRRDCASELRGSVAWPDHLDCSTLPSRNCISGSDPVQGYDACVQLPTPKPHAIIQVPPENEHICERFEQSYCQCFSPSDRTHAVFPNPRNQYAKDAQREFSDFTTPGRNIIESGCSDKIGTLLCFFYFPHCNPPTDTSNNNTLIRNQDDYSYSLPCRDLCEEVHRDCVSKFNNISIPWPDHLNCSALPTVNCISGRDPQQGYHACVSPPIVPSPEAPTSIDLPPETHRICEQFDQPYCHCFNPSERTHALFPNHRNQTAREAEEEFDHFIQPGGNVIKSGCSDKIGTLLCFFYFPPCNPPQPEDGAGRGNTAVTVNEFWPCRALCEEARRDCEGEFAKNRHQPQWQDLYLHLDCSRLPSTNCINGSDPIQGYDACVDDDILNIVKPREPEAPVTTAPPCDPDSCPTCSLRTNCNGGTFIKNGYTWAARVTVLKLNGTVNGKKVYLVQVEEQYLFHQSQPTLKNLQVIQTTNPECCSDCPHNIAVGGKYLFSGFYTIDPLVWYLEVKNRGSIVSAWSPKYQANLAMWIARGVASRVN